MSFYKNIFLYWVSVNDNIYPLISLLRSLIFLHNSSDPSCSVHLITPKNLHEYYSPTSITLEQFHKLHPAHQADIIRVHCLCEYGGIWLDSDTLVLESLEELFRFLKTHDGFFIFEQSNHLCNGVFGSRPQTPLMLEWRRMINERLKSKRRPNWTSFGSDILNQFLNTNLMQTYSLLDGRATVYPVNWDECVEWYLNKPRARAKEIEREFQPLLILVNSVYKAIQVEDLVRGFQFDNEKEEKEEDNGVLYYFIQKSFAQLKSAPRLDFIEIGAGRNNTLLDSSFFDNVEAVRGIFVEPVREHLDALPSSTNVKKIHAAISNFDSTSISDNYIAYVPSEFVQQRRLPEWILGCNTLNRFHSMHVRLRLRRNVIQQPIQVNSCMRLFCENGVHEVDVLKIKTEGEDYKILENLFLHLRWLPKTFRPQKIIFYSTFLSREQLKQLQLWYCDELDYDCSSMENSVDNQILWTRG